jgi:hypothetical protein
MNTADKLKKIAENEAIVAEANQRLFECVNGGTVDAKSWYDEFWDKLQQGGRRTGYRNTFYDWQWDNSIYNPKYPIVCSGNSLDMMRYSSITDTIVDITFTNVGSSYVFANNVNLKTIRKLIITDKVTFVGWFTDCTALENIVIEGTIGQNGFDIHWSTLLSADSLKSIITALSTTTTGLTVTLPTTAQANYEAKYGTGSWSVLVATRSNWTIAYA